MDLFPSQSDALAQAIRDAASQSVEAMETDSWIRVDVKTLIKAEKESRPPGQVADARAFAQRYLGNQSAIIRAKLYERYPLSAARMPVAPLPYIRQWARADSGCYQQEATRVLVSKASGEPLPDADPMQEAYGTALERARVSEVAPECERRARTGIKCAVVHVSWMPPIDENPGRCLLQHYWAHDVMALAHPSYPTEEEALIFVALRQGQDRWMAYRRLFTQDPDGVVDQWGPWEIGRWTDGKEEQATWSEYEGTVLPVPILRLEPGDGGVWPAAERDSYLVADQLNTSRSNLEHVSDLQGHSNLVTSSNTLDENDLGIGPDSHIPLRTGDSAQWISPAPALEALRAGIEEKQSAVAIARGNDANAYSASPGAPESGIARIVAKFPHELALRESRETVRRFDERLCRVVMDVSDTWGDTNFGTMFAPRTVLAPTVVFEDPTAKQMRALANLDAGAISAAQYAVEIGLYPNVDKAAADGYDPVARMRALPEPEPTLSAALPVVSDAPGE